MNVQVLAFFVGLIIRFVRRVRIERSRQWVETIPFTYFSPSGEIVPAPVEDRFRIVVKDFPVFFREVPQGIHSDGLTGSLEITAGTVFGNYRIIRQLGKGGMGAVFLAEDLRVNREFALKILFPTLGYSDRTRRLFAHEAAVIRALEGYDLAPTYHDSGVVGVYYFIAMEYFTLPWRTLDAYKGTLHWQEGVEIAIELVAQLQNLHGLGVFHHDLKPENIVAAKINGQWQVRFLDFGLARTEAAPKFEVGKYVGSPAFSSPERIRDGSEGVADLRGDEQFGVAATVYNLLTDRLLADNNNAQLTMDMYVNGTLLVRPPHEFCPGLPEEVSAAIVRGASLAAENRFLTLAEFGQALLSHAGESVRDRHASTFGVAPSL